MARRSAAAFVAYVPVLHRGYIEFFDRYPDMKTLYICGPGILKQQDYLRKDLRALTPFQQMAILQSMGRFDDVQVVEMDDIARLSVVHERLVLPDEDISRCVVNGLDPALYELSPVFLRWDRQSVAAADDRPEDMVTADDFEQTVMREALAAANQSSDIWRRLSAIVITADGDRLGPFANQGEPTPHSPWMEGDPRNIFSQGVGIEMSVFSHAEAVLIAEAARRGIALEGATMFVSTFPCPACAKLIAHSGIAKCFYKDGYGVLDGRRIMEDYGVKLARVQMDDDNARPDVAAVPYPPKF